MDQGRKFANHSRFGQVKCDKSIGTGFSKKKISNFNEEQGIISNRIIKNYNAFCQSLKR
jgi:hypothetical protein